MGVVAYSIAWANGHGSTPGSNSHTLFNNIFHLRGMHAGAECQRELRQTLIGRASILSLTSILSTTRCRAKKKR